MKEKLRKYWRKYKYLAILIVFLIVAVIFLFPYLSPGRASITNIYSTSCSGEWFGSDRVLGPPDVLPDDDTERFNPENSAFYRGGDATIICEGFNEDFNNEKEKFISARLGISLAIHEFKNKTEEQKTPEESAETTEETPAEQVPENNLPETSPTEETETEQPTVEQPSQEEPEQVPNPENLEQPQGQSESVSLDHKFNDFIPLEIIPRRSTVWVTARSISHGKLITPWEFLTGFIRTNIFKIFPVLAQEEQINKNINQVLTNESPVEPLLIEIPNETNQPIEDLTPVFLPIEIKTEETTTSTILQEVLPIDAVLNIRYLLGKNSYYLNTISSYPISPALHGGYLYFDLPEVKSLNDLEKVKVSLEGLLGGDPRIISYLDSLWIEIIYEETEEIVLPALEMDKNSWRSDEEPIIKINSQPNHLVKVDSFKKSLVKKLGFLSNEEKIELSLIDSGNQEIALDLDKDFKIEEVNNLSQIKLLRPRSFRPGHYKLKFKIQQNKENAEVNYNFQWGVLAINTNKSIYLSNEDAYLQMAALNDLGNTLCDANLRLSVLNEASGQETIFTTSDKSIEKSGQCGPNNVVDVPDYFVHYQVGAEGKYDLTLTNLDNGYEINDSFEVKSAVPFEVERIGPTRIYPLANYQMSIRIKTNENFTGLITETIPSSFKIVSVNTENSGQATVSSPTEDQQDNEKIINFLEKKKTSWNEQETEEKNISWQVDWQAGQSYELKYEFDAPDISPYFYLLGPLSFVGIHGSTQMGTQINTDISVDPCDEAPDQCKSVFQEARNWQIASDAIVYIQTANDTGIGSATAVFSAGATANNMIIAVCGANEIGQLSIEGFSTAIDESNMPFFPPGQAIFYKVATGNEGVAIGISCISVVPTAIVGLHIYEYRGLATSSSTDGTGSATGNGTDPSTGVVTTSNADDLLMAGVIYLANVSGFSSWSNSFTERNDFTDPDPGSVSFGGAERIVSATGDYTTTATRGAAVLGAWRGQIAAFKMTTGITVYGTIYSDEGSTVFDCSTPTHKTITLKVNGLGTYSGPCITSQGTFAIPGVIISAANDVVTAYIDGATQKGVVITKAANTTSDINLSIYQDRAILRHEGATAITNADLAQYDKDQDPDIHFDSDSGALTVDNDTELHIWTGKTFAPGGAVTTSAGGTAPGSDLHIDDSATFTAGGAISIGGNWTADTGTTFTHNNNAVTFTATAIGKTIATNAQNFYDVIFNGSGGGWSFSDTGTISNDLTMTAGTLSGTQSINVNGGDIICGASCGTINLSSSSTVTLAGTGNFGTAGLASNWTFYNLTFSGTTTAQGAGTITVSNVLTISATKSLDAGSKTWTLSGNTGAPFVLSGTFTPNASTFSYTGNNGSGNTTVVATTYNNLTVNNALETYVLAGTTNLNGDLNITNGTLDVTATNHALNVKGSWTNAGTFTAQSGTVTFNGTASGKTINPASSSFYVLTFNGSGGVWTLSTNNLDIDNNLNITTGTLSANTLNINLAGNLAIGANGIFTKGSGTFTFDGSGTSTWADSSSGQDLGTAVVDGSSKTINLGSSVKVTKLTIGADDTLNLGASSYTLTLTGSGAGASKPLIIETGGTLTIGTSTIEYTGGATTDVTTGTWNYYNLTFNGTGPFNLTATDVITNNLTITSGTFDVTASNYDLSVGNNWSNSGTFTARAGTVTFTATDSGNTITSGSSPFYRLTFNGLLGAWTLQDALDVNNTFSLDAGTLTQAANANINFGGDTTLALGATFTKASGTGKIIFDGTAKKFTDNTTPKQNLGNIEIGTSPDDVTLCTDSIMDSLTVNAGDIYYTNGWDIDVTTSIAVSGTLDATDPASSGVCTSEGNQTQINLGTNWTVAATATFTAGSSTVVFDEATVGSLSSGGTDGNHDFNNLTISKTPPSGTKTVTLTSYNLDVSGNLDISNATSVLDVSATNYNINVGGNWSNAGTFTARAGTVTFDAGSTGKTIDSGGTGATKDFYNIVFNNASGGWTIQTNNLTATNNFTITDTAASSGFIVEANRTVTVNGNFTNGEGGTTTTWNSGTVLNLTKTGGGSYTINTKTTGGDVYVTLQVGANTDIRMWDSSASTYTVNASGSLYSMDAGGTSGDLAIWGDYHTTSGNTDYWSYANDFDGTAGANRQVDVTISASTSVTVDLSGILYVQGGGSASNDITVVGLAKAVLWNFACSGTCNVQESTWNYLNLTAGTLTVYNSTLNNEDAPDAGATLNVDWYLGDYVVDRATLAAIDTGANDITISENSGTPASTVFKWSGGVWSSGATSQTTGTGADGKIPQVGTDGAIRIREYARASTGYTYYKYNLYITWQGSTYGEYDYYNGYGKNYLTSTLNLSSGEDECISESWQRNDIDVQNTPAQAIDDPPTNGTWYNGMISGLSFTVALVASGDCTISGGSKITTTATTVPYSTIISEHFYDACQSLTVSTSASEGYTATVQETDQLTEPVNSDIILDGNCDGGGSPCSETTSAAWNTDTNNGFAYCMDDITGDAAATAQAVNWAAAKQCGGASQSFMINPENNFDNPDTADMMKSAGPISGDNSYIGFRLSVDGAQEPGAYSTTIVYVVTPTY